MKKKKKKKKKKNRNKEKINTLIKCYLFSKCKRSYINVLEIFKIFI